MLRLTAVIVLLCAVAAACGSGGQNAAKAAVPASTDLTKRPLVVVPSGPPPTSLVITDIVTGTGATAKADSTVTVQYVGVSYTSKQPFDASWDRNQPFPFQLGASQVIAGWEKGVVGMKVGGRRQLIIPPSLAYGAQGNGPIGPNETLIFVIDLLSIG